MAIMTRLGNLLKADVHAVLDRIEEPEALLRQAIREMEEDILERERQVHQSEWELDALSSRLQEANQILQESDSELQLCLQEGNDELAKYFIRRKLETDKLCKVLQQKQQSAVKTLKQQQENIREDRLRMESMQQKAELLTENNIWRNSVSQEAGTTHRDTDVSEEEIEAALLREKTLRDKQKHTSATSKEK